MDLDSARGGHAAPYNAGDVRRVIAALPGISTRKVSRVLHFPRARLRARPRGWSISSRTSRKPQRLVKTEKTRLPTAGDTTIGNHGNDML